MAIYISTKSAKKGMRYTGILAISEKSTAIIIMPSHLGHKQQKTASWFIEKLCDLCRVSSRTLRNFPTDIGVSPEPPLQHQEKIQSPNKHCHWSDYATILTVQLALVPAHFLFLVYYPDPMSDPWVDIIFVSKSTGNLARVHKNVTLGVRW
jgi:hypothetical protein